jgi:hypothetical protein
MKNDKLLYDEIKQLIEKARSFIVQNVNTTLVFTNYHIGKTIVKDEQQGSERAKYAEKTLGNLSKKLTKEFGKGYTKRNLELMRKFYITFAKTKSLISQSEKMKSSIAQSEVTGFLINQSPYSSVLKTSEVLSITE